MQARLERTPLGKALISVFLLATLASVIVWNLPDSEVRSKSLRLAQPYIFFTGLDQNWGVFAPDPRRQSLWLKARIRYDDGSTSMWELPTADPVVGHLWDYRWRKWMEYVTNEQYRSVWQPAAEWLAREHDADGRRPVRVTLIRRFMDLLPPGYQQFGKGWQEKAYYTLDITPEMLESRG